MTDGLLTSIGRNIWISGGKAVDVAGFSYPTRMAVIRLADGDLFVWSPIALGDDLRREVDALGAVRFIIAPNTLHHLFVPEWRRAYPGAKLCAAPGFTKRQPHIPTDATLGDAPPAEWSAQVDQVIMYGNRITTEVVFFHRESATVLFTDLIQNFPRGWFKGWRGLVARLDRLDAAEPEVPQKFRLAFSDRRTARGALERILAWPAEKLIMAHGPLISTHARDHIARALRWLKR